MVEEEKNIANLISVLLANLQVRISAIVELFQSGDLVQANERFVFLIDDLLVLLEGVKSINKEESGIDIEEMNEKLQLILQQFENKDFMFVSELMTYELLPLLQHWSDTINDE